MKIIGIKTVAIGLAVAALVLSPLSAVSETLPFDKAWKKQGFLRLRSNKFSLGGESLQVSSNGTVSLIYRRVPEELWGSRSASWKWAVSQSVGPTDLTVKGGDDRNLALYFVFLEAESAPALAKLSARKLLRHPDVRALVYVWGGDYAPETVLYSPYGPETLRTVIKRSAGTGEFRETVDLVADFQRAFGREPGVLVGLGITADSDDTRGKISGVVHAIDLN